MPNNSTLSDGKKRKQIVLSAIESMYGESNRDKYFLVKSKTASEVRNEIANQFENVGLDKKKIDLYVMISQINDDVFIKVSQ